MTRREMALIVLTGAMIVLGAILLVSQAWSMFVAPAGGTDQVHLVDGPPQVSYSNSALLKFADLDSTESRDFECNVDNTGWQKCNGNHSPGSPGYWGKLVMPDLSPGRHTVRIRTNGADSGEYSWNQVEPTPAMICSRWRDWYAPQIYLIENPDTTICPQFVQSDAIYKKNFPENGYPETPRCKPNVCSA